VHGDHRGGLELIASVKPDLRVYIPPDTTLAKYVKNLSLKPIIVNNTIEVARGVYVVKPLYGPPVEATVAVNTGQGLVVLVGCSHPGVVNIVKQATVDLGAKPYMVIGGFHMSGATLGEIEEVISGLIELGVKRVYPIHCSGEEVREYLAEYYGKAYGDGGVGLEITIK